MQDVNEALKKIHAGAGTPAPVNPLQDALKDMPMVKKSKKTITKSVPTKEPFDPSAPIATSVSKTKSVVKRAGVTRAIKQVEEHQQNAEASKSKKTTRLALREIDSGEFVDARKAAKEPDNVATDFVSLPGTAKKTTAKKTGKVTKAAKKTTVKKAAKKTAAKKSK